jgi:hypothetical protein
VKARRRRARRSPVHAVLKAVRQLVEAFRHAITGGASTRRRATRRAAAPPKPCPTCHRPMPHSGDWRDHLHQH